VLGVYIYLFLQFLYLDFGAVPTWGHVHFKITSISHPVGKQTHDLTVIASDSKTTQSGGDNRKKFPLGAVLQVPQNFSFAPL
jgi:hypothetical protein